MNEPGRNSKRSRWRLAAAFAVVPIVDGILAFAVFPIIWPVGAHGRVQPVDPFSEAASFGVLTGVVALLVTLAGAVPVVSWLINRRRASFANIVKAGLALGNAPFAVYALAAAYFALLHLIGGTMSQHLVPLSSLLAGTLRVIGLGSGLGVAGAVVFWLAALRPSGNRGGRSERQRRDQRVMV